MELGTDAAEEAAATGVPERLQGLIGRAFPAGSRLPPERALAERLGVNRGTLRKALARLEAEGRITRQVGRGTFVSEAPIETAGTASPIELMDARLALEPAIAGEAALRARRDHLVWLDRCLAHGEGAEDYRAFEEWDVAFHRTIAEATQNPIFIMVMDAMRRMRGQEAWERLKRASFGPATRDRYRAEHRAVLQALEQRDQRAAAAAMFAHLRSVRATIFSDGLWGREASAKEGPTP
ncbi:MAG: FadR family transcriptional regulator [Geminicoccaceae bacterium]|nr:FadR family transcriptional regulator [Geminicoccaceae bacterium]